MSSNNGASLTSRAMLVTLKIKAIGMARIDHNLSDDINVNHFQVGNAGRYMKTKVERGDLYDHLHIAYEARDYHRMVTVPWQHLWRLLPAARILEYTQKMATCKVQYDNATADLQRRWPAVVANQQTRLGKLFDANEYPDASDLPEFFTFDHLMQPVPDVNHIILDIETEVVNDLKKKLEEENAKRVEESKREMYAKLYNPVKRMADICGGDKNVYDSMIQNLVDVAEVLQDLNVMNDHGFNTQLSEVLQKLTGFTPGQIRKDSNLKAKLGQDAKLIADKLAAQIGMFATTGGSVQ